MDEGTPHPAADHTLGNQLKRIVGVFPNSESQSGPAGLVDDGTSQNNVEDGAASEEKSGNSEFPNFHGDSKGGNDDNISLGSNNLVDTSTPDTGFVDEEKHEIQSANVGNDIETQTLNDISNNNDSSPEQFDEDSAGHRPNSGNSSPIYRSRIPVYRSPNPSSLPQPNPTIQVHVNDEKNEYDNFNESEPGSNNYEEISPGRQQGVFETEEGDMRDFDIPEPGSPLSRQGTVVESSNGWPTHQQDPQYQNWAQEHDMRDIRLEHAQAMIRARGRERKLQRQITDLQILYNRLSDANKKAQKDVVDFGYSVASRDIQIRRLKNEKKALQVRIKELEDWKTNSIEQRIELDKRRGKRNQRPRLHGADQAVEYESRKADKKVRFPKINTNAGGDRERKNHRSQKRGDDSPSRSRSRSRSKSPAKQRHADRKYSSPNRTDRILPHTFSGDLQLEKQLAEAARKISEAMAQAPEEQPCYACGARKDAVPSEEVLDQLRKARKRNAVYKRALNLMSKKLDEKNDPERVIKLQEKARVDKDAITALEMENKNLRKEMRRLERQFETVDRRVSHSRTHIPPARFDTSSSSSKLAANTSSSSPPSSSSSSSSSSSIAKEGTEANPAAEVVLDANGNRILSLPPNVKSMFELERSDRDAILEEVQSLHQRIFGGVEVQAAEQRARDLRIKLQRVERRSETMKARIRTLKRQVQLITNADSDSQEIQQVKQEIALGSKPMEKRTKLIGKAGTFGTSSRRLDPIERPLHDAKAKVAQQKTAEKEPSDHLDGDGDGLKSHLTVSRSKLEAERRRFRATDKQRQKTIKKLQAMLDDSKGRIISFSKIVDRLTNQLRSRGFHWSKIRELTGGTDPNRLLPKNNPLQTKSQNNKIDHESEAKSSSSLIVHPNITGTVQEESNAKVQSPLVQKSIGERLQGDGTYKNKLKRSKFAPFSSSQDDSSGLDTTEGLYDFARAGGLFDFDEDELFTINIDENSTDFRQKLLSNQKLLSRQLAKIAGLGNKVKGKLDRHHQRDAPDASVVITKLDGGWRPMMYAVGPKSDLPAETLWTEFMPKFVELCKRHLMSSLYDSDGDIYLEALLDRRPEHYQGLVDIFLESNPDCYYCQTNFKKFLLNKLNKWWPYRCKEILTIMRGIVPRVQGFRDNILTEGKNTEQLEDGTEPDPVSDETKFHSQKVLSLVVSRVLKFDEKLAYFNLSDEVLNALAWEIVSVFEVTERQLRKGAEGYENDFVPGWYKL